MNGDGSLGSGEQRQHLRFGFDPGGTRAEPFEGELIDDGTVVTNPELRRDLLTGFDSELGSIERRARTHALDGTDAVSPGEATASGQNELPVESPLIAR